MPLLPSALRRSRSAPRHRTHAAAPASHAALERLEDRRLLSASGWFHGFTGANTTAAAGSAVDSSGNLITAGNFTAGSADGVATLDLDGSGAGATLTKAGTGSDGYVAKHDPSGALLWANQIATSPAVINGQTRVGTIYATGGWGDVAVDAAGNAYFMSTFAGRLDFLSRDAAGNTQVEASLTSGSPADIFIVKYAADGMFQWAKSFGNAEGGNWGYGIAVADHDADPASWSVYVVGRTERAADFDPGPGAANRQYSGGFLASYSAADGGFRWVRQLTSTTGTLSYFAPYRDVAADQNGVYVGGHFGGQGTVEGGAAGSVTVGLLSSGADGILASYTHAGNLRWVQRIGGSGEQIVEGVAVANGAVYATGSFVGTSDFEMTHESKKVKDDLVSAGGRDGFVAKYTSSGGRRTWAKRFGGSDNDYGYAIAVDAAAKKVAVGGTFRKSANFGGDIPALATPDPTTANPDAFAAVLSDFGSSAKFTNAWRMGGAGAVPATSTSEAVTGIEFDPRGTGALYVVGNYSSPAADFPNGQTLTRSSDRTDAFIGRFVPSATPQITGAAATDDEELEQLFATSDEESGDGLLGELLAV